MEKKDLHLSGKTYNRGTIPQKVSDLENDVPYVTEEELNNLLSGGGGSSSSLLVNISTNLSPEDSATIKVNLKIPDQAENVPSGNIDW